MVDGTAALITRQMPETGATGEQQEKIQRIHFIYFYLGHKIAGTRCSNFLAIPSGEHGIWDQVSAGGLEGGDARGLHPGGRGVPHRPRLQPLARLHHREGHGTAAVSESSSSVQIHSQMSTGEVETALEIPLKNYNFHVQGPKKCFA